MNSNECKVCNEEFLDLRKFNNHLKQCHNLSPLDYHIEYILNGIKPICKCGYCNEIPEYRDNIFHDFAVGHKGPKWREKNYIIQYGNPICKTCGKPVKFTRGVPNQYCSLKCVPNGWNQETCKKTLKEHYGVDNPWQSEEIKEKIKGTLLKNYGVENISQSNEIKKKKEETCFKNYNVKNPIQNKEIFEKAQKSGYKIKKFRDTNIWYQGTFEFDFLEKYYDKYPDIQRGLSIKYVVGDKHKVYYSDFFIPSLNLIVEIKSSWIIELQGINQIEEKKKATITAGFNYIMIVDKNYIELN
jgi:hypothetical protein